jgi:uncharacterized protein YbjQ (UPF0145 family)
MTTTTFTFDGYRVEKTFGVVRGIKVRSRSIVGTIGAACRRWLAATLPLTELCGKLHRRVPNR